MGKKIKILRIKRGITQEELAEKLGVSSQAVSKWENDVSLPDMQMLPELSMYFGITIDELFDMTDEAHMERIQNMIYDERMLTSEDFCYAKSFLTGKLTDRNKNKRAECLTMLADLHNHRADGYHGLAAAYAKDALSLKPDCKDSHSALREAMNGAVCDWNVANHYEIIIYYKDFVKKNPEYWQGYLWLLDNLIADGRAEEAKEALERMNQIHPGYLYNAYKAKIKHLEGCIEEAENLIKQMLKENEDEWRTWFCAGDFMSETCQYDKAIECYRKAYELQPKPRYTDSLDAIADIYIICNCKGKAEATLNDEIQLLGDEWNVTMGEAIDKIKRKIESL